MQTFLPFDSFYISAHVLDSKRLSKQLIEVQQIWKSLTDIEYGWKNHPAVKMWQGYEIALLNYGCFMYSEWLSRYPGKTHKSGLYIRDEWIKSSQIVVYPKWLGNVDFHRSHRSNLLRKNKEHYASYFEVGLPSNLDYVWPV